MALTKQKVQDKIEIVGQFRSIQIRYADQIVEDGSVISQSYWRTVVNCGDYDAADEHNVRAIADAIWTEEMIASYQESIKESIIGSVE
jgi:hypothetical protein